MIEQIHPRDFPAWLRAARAVGPPVVLDVREPAELQIASVTPGDFTLLTIPMGNLMARLGELDSATPTACLCHHGARSMQVAAFLQGQGFKHLANIAGGINAWSDQLDTTIPRY